MTTPCEGTPWAPLADVTQLPISDLATSPNPDLLAAIRRVTASLNDPDGVISAFGSFIS
jgi:FXSXX-COOH protein